MLRKFGKLRKHEKFPYRKLIPRIVIDDWSYVMQNGRRVEPVRREDSIIFFCKAAVMPSLYEPSMLGGVITCIITSQPPSDSAPYLKPPSTFNLPFLHKLQPKTLSHSRTPRST